MKLTKLRLVNYRNHADTTLDLTGASLIVVRGANASGKSSIGQSISINLTNTTMGLDTAGKGFTSKIKTGDVKAVITADIQGNHLLRNIVTLQTNTSGRTSNVECIDSPDDNKIVNGFTNFLKDRKSAILIACNTDFYSRLEEKDQIALLAKLVLPAHYDFPADKIEATNGFLDTPINFDAEPFEVITKAYKALYKERETINRQVKDFDVPDALPIPKGVDSESLQAQLVGIREQRVKLQADRDAAVKAANEVEVNRGRLQTKIEGLRGEVDKGKKRLAVLDAEILSADKLKQLQDCAAMDSELTRLNSDHSVLQGAIASITSQVSRLKEVSEQGSTCPVCDQDIDSAKITVLVEELETELAGADKRIQELDKQIEAIGDVQEAIQSLKDNDAAVKEHAELEASLREIVKTGKETKTALEALGEVVNATLPFNDPLADLQAKEDKINEQIRPVVAAEERAKERERLTEQLGKLQKKAATLDSLVKYYDKDGIKKELIGTYVGGFESKVNFVLSAWGYKTSLTMEPFNFEVTTPRGYCGPVKELSGAEEHIFKAAFQCAVSIAAGIKLVVIDEVQALGEDIRPYLYSKCFELIQSGELDQAILIGFSLDKTIPPKEKRAPGSKYFFITDGTVEELK